MKEILIALIYALTYFLPVAFLLFLLLCLCWHNDPILFRDKVTAPWYASIFGRRALQKAIDEHYYDYRTMPFDTFLTLYRSNPENGILISTTPGTPRDMPAGAPISSSPAEIFAAIAAGQSPYLPQRSAITTPGLLKSSAKKTLPTLKI